MDEEKELSREELRRQILRQTEESMVRRAGDPQYLDREKFRRQEKIRDRFSILTLLLVAAAAVMFYMHNYTYTTYSLDFTSPMGAGRSSEVYAFCEGDIVIGTDSVTYIKAGTVVFTAQIQLRDTITAFRDGYFAVCEREGYQVYVFDETGLLSTVRVSRKILGMDISASGVTAIFTESSEASYISYFDRYGNRLPVEVKSVLSVSGYPVHISISPDGQRLLVLYYSTVNGVGESRLVLYDFLKGKESVNYVVGTVEDYYERDTFLVDSEFIDDSHAIAVGDHGITFLKYDADKRTLTPSFVDLTEEIASVFFTESYFGTLVKKGTYSEVTLYDTAGQVVNVFPVAASYQKVIANDRYMVLQDEKMLYMYNMSGRHRYTGILVDKPVSMAFCDGRSLFMNTGSVLQRITLK